MDSVIAHTCHTTQLISCHETRVEDELSVHTDGTSAIQRSCFYPNELEGGHIPRDSYLIRDKASCEEAFACASIAVPVCMYR
jgi:hypothetical protein